MKSMKGFTLVELVIVIVIVGILSVVAVPVYKGYTKKAMATEGKALLGAINTSQKVYFAEWANFATGAQSAALDVDAGTNKYFTTYALTGTAAGFTATTAGAGGAAGIGLTIVGSSTGPSEITESGLK
ncbi:MAG: prepilin-type N-terminal cleavage/methylation domain-containing protein [Endomicrobiaceae bacterium]|nr:prepilin-type N-terminal cleavage/methylation domain-containing protein [Endomicrobiaceae bacterium]